MRTPQEAKTTAAHCYVVGYHCARCQEYIIFFPWFLFLAAHNLPPLPLTSPISPCETTVFGALLRTIMLYGKIVYGYSSKSGAGLPLSTQPGTNSTKLGIPLLYCGNEIPTIIHVYRRLTGTWRTLRHRALTLCAT